MKWKLSCVYYDVRWCRTTHWIETALDRSCSASISSFLSFRIFPRLFMAWTYVGWSLKVTGDMQHEVNLLTCLQLPGLLMLVRGRTWRPLCNIQSRQLHFLCQPSSYQHCNGPEEPAINIQDIWVGLYMFWCNLFNTCTTRQSIDFFYLGIEGTDRKGTGEEALLRPPLVTAESAASYIHRQQHEHRHTEQLL